MSTLHAPVDRRVGLREQWWGSRWWPLPPPASTAARRLVVVALVGGVLARFIPSGPLWFDEVQSVAIAHLPVPQLFGALRQDGSPPLYYLLLHAWMLVFGTGTWTVRALSGVLSSATIPAFAVLARRTLPEPARWPAVLLLATSPFAIRYATETRMYALVVLLVVVGGILVCRVLEQPTWGRMAPLPLLSAALALTHYWGLFLLAATGAGLAWRAARPSIRGLPDAGPIGAIRSLQGSGAPGSIAGVDESLAARRSFPGAGGLRDVGCVDESLAARRSFPGAGGLRDVGSVDESLAARRAVIGLAGGAVLYLPWLPSMLFQIGHTGTPWAHAGPLAALIAFGVWAGAMHTSLALLFAIPLACVLLALVAQAALRVPQVRPILWVTIGMLAVAGLASVVLGSAVVPRYTSVGLALYLLVAAAGIGTLAPDLRTKVLRVALAFGLVVGVLDSTSPRTLAGRVASVLHHQGGPGDTVVYCPDQLGPDVARLLPGWSQQMMFPTGAFPYRVDWVNYASRNLSASPLSFAQTVVAGSNDHPIWLLEATNYLSFGDNCQALAADLASMRPDAVTVPLQGNPMADNEQETLVEFLPNPRL